MNPFPDILISKSRYLSGLRCDKLLWCHYHDKEIFPPHGKATLARLKQGHVVGRLAHHLFPEGIEVSPDSYLARDVVPQTQEFLAKRIPLFEAGFVHRSAYARVDILNPVEDAAWDLYEVKSTGGYKPEKHLADVAAQCYVLEGNGLNIRRCCLVHINKEYVRNGDVDPMRLFTATDVTEDVDGFIESVDGDIAGMIDIVRQDRCPERPITANCWLMGGCDLQPVCWEALPENHVLTLSSGRNKGLILLGMGIERLEDIPEGFSLTRKQAVQVQAVRSGELQVDGPLVRNFLDGLQYPLSFLDFETVGPAVPVYDKTKPFQAVPFQFSVHVVSEPDALSVHNSFLADGKDDPRPALARKLKEILPENGSVIAYNAAFERRILADLAQVLPVHSGWIEESINRIVDLYEPFRNFSVYHPNQCGSASMKAILPAFSAKDYDKDGISGGEEASMEFLRITFGSVSDKERRTVRKQLEEYCRLDTEGMVDVLGKLHDILGYQ